MNIPPTPHGFDFDALCTPLQPALLARARQLCRDRAAAEDLVQDTYLHALEVWSTFAPEGRPKDRASAWLHQMLMNLFRDRYRIGVRRAEIAEVSRDEIIEETMGISSSSNSGAREWLPRANARAQAATEALDANQREVVLRFADGESYKDISAAVGIDMGTVRSRLHRARRRLVSALEPAA